MKKVILLLIFFCTNVFAETFNIIVSGKPGGTFHTRSMLMHDALLELGHEVNLINAGDLSKASQIFQTTNSAVIMPWIDSANLKENLQPNELSFGILEYQAPIVFCSQKYNDFTAKEIVIGYSASWPKEILTSLEKATGKKVKSIPYRNSGDLVLGFLSNDLNYIAINLSQIDKLPQSSCFAITSEKTFQNIKPLSKILPNYHYHSIKQHAYWLQKNNDVDNLRSILIKAINTTDYKNWIDSQLFESNSTWSLEDLRQSQQGAYDWGLK